MGPAYDPRMTIPDPKSTLVEGLGLLNEQVLHKLDGLSEHDLRRPNVSPKYPACTRSWST